jgi:hypothetical protein
MNTQIKTILDSGIVIPAHPLALDANRKLDERRQRALTRYYIAAGAGGIAVGVHTTQFAIRQPQIGLFDPVLTLAKEEMDRADPTRPNPLVRIAGVCGQTAQAVAEAQLITERGYHAALLSLAALADADEDELIAHCHAVANIIPLIGFYLQPAAGGRNLPFSFWRRFAEIKNVVAIKIAPFNRYQTIDVVRAVIEAGRDDITLYTGNDDNIVIDLLTPYRFHAHGQTIERNIVGGLLGHWSVWTQKAVELLEQCQAVQHGDAPMTTALLRRNIEVTDTNAAFFDTANNYQGVIAGLHEVLRRQGLLQGIWCLDENETLGPGQLEQINRIYTTYPHLNDDTFITQHRNTWLTG